MDLQTSQNKIQTNRKWETLVPFFYPFKFLSRINYFLFLRISSLLLLLLLLGFPSQGFSASFLSYSVISFSSFFRIFFDFGCNGACFEKLCEQWGCWFGEDFSLCWRCFGCCKGGPLAVPGGKVSSLCYFSLIYLLFELDFVGSCLKLRFWVLGWRLFGFSLFVFFVGVGKV